MERGSTARPVTASMKVQVEIMGFSPVLPCIEPGAKIERAVQIERGAPSHLAWLPDRSLLALINGGRQYSWTANQGISGLSSLSSTGADVTCHAVVGAGELATSTTAGLTCVSVDEGTASPLQYQVGLQPQVIVSLSGRRVITAANSDVHWTVMLWGEDGSSHDLIRFEQPVYGMCISEDESHLFIAARDTVWRATFDTVIGVCGTPQPFCSTAPLASSSLAIDTLSNLYVCTSEGVHVCDDQGDFFLRLRTPAEATSCCFGGSSLSTLFISAADSIWAIKANVQGVAAASEELQQRIDKQVGAGDFRHVGW
eukprot:CAMPEP_0119317406 /NCGR_PEP_ID=MMETSP1333-20130426/43047_1 /TAXON_ID=418940 /ORGANISM="Scyphosphaera apsteinii, Strain RCC1455" /LENGTH=311 /DNA_ID=CAMNT_0007323327 /DNA_START=84 /DNA_END=1019 /DNA_ORIENTATION=-